MGLRNSYLDKFLPARTTAKPQQPEAAPARPPLQFVHEPITDLDIPDPARCDGTPHLLLLAAWHCRCQHCLATSTLIGRHIV